MCQPSFNRFFREGKTDRLSELQQLLQSVEDAEHLLRADQLTMRLNILDRLDAVLGGVEPGVFETILDPDVIARAKSVRRQFEAANEMLYEAAHSEIARQGNWATLKHWLAELATNRETKRPHPGLSFDLLDEIVTGVLRLCEPANAGPLPSPEMTAYQPTPTRHILDLISAGRFSSEDILVDLGSGLGHVPLLVCILTGIRTLGVEVQPDHAACAHETAQCLNLSRVRFVAEDARSTDLSTGTVFYMFTPFTGSILTEVLHRLHGESATRQIRICALGHCTRILQLQTWLTANRQPSTERVTIFRSR